MSLKPTFNHGLAFINKVQLAVIFLFHKFCTGAYMRQAFNRGLALNQENMVSNIFMYHSFDLN